LAFWKVGSGSGCVEVILVTNICVGAVSYRRSVVRGAGW